MARKERVPCPECNKSCRKGPGVAIHRRQMHGILGRDATRALKVPVPGTASSTVAELQERDDRIAVLESRQMHDYPPADQGAYLLHALSRLGAGTVAVLVAKAGKDSILSEAAAADITRVEEPDIAEVLPDDVDGSPTEAPLPAFVHGRAEAPGYKYLGTLGISVREAARND